MSATSKQNEKVEHLFTEDGFLNDILSKQGLTERVLLEISDDCLLQYSLLILATIGQYGSLDSTSPRFTALLQAFCLRAGASRPIKLRTALLMYVADLGINETWHPKVYYDPACYDNDTAAEAAAFEDAPTLSSATAGTRPSSKKILSVASISADDLLRDDNLLNQYVAHRFFHPKTGIALETKRRYCCIKTYNSAFSEYEALLFIMQDLLLSDMSTASAIGAKMDSQGHIRQVTTTTSWRKKRFGQGRSLYCRGPRKFRFDRSSKSVVATASSMMDKVGIEVSFGLDLIDMQSIDFWRSTLFDKPLVEGLDFGRFAVVHPMAVAAHNVDEEDCSFGNHGGYVVHNVKVEKVMASMAKPGFLSLSAYSPGAVLIPADETAAMEISPRVIAKTGDNLINDHSVELMFRVFNHVWRKDTERFGGTPPLSFAYDVVPTGERAGLLECLSGLKPLNDYDWKAWVAAYKNDAEVLSTMVRSAAGSSVATYVLGIGDRHWDNIQIKDGQTLLHIDFGMILGENPPFKTPRFSISGDMEDAFKAVGIWEPFVMLVGQAFLSLRARANALIHNVALVLRHAGREHSKILKYLVSKDSFNLSEQDDTAAAHFVTYQVRESSKNWETVLRKFTHDKVDPVFFRMATAAPPGLVAAVEKLYER